MSVTEITPGLNAPASTTPASHTPPSDGSAQDIIEALSGALALHRAGKLEHAEEAYRRVLEADPNQPSALRLLGLLRLSIGRAADAVGLLRRSVTADPANLDTRLALADATAATGNQTEAVAEYRAVLAQHPAHPAALVNLANVLSATGDYDGAITACEEALAGSPTLVQARATLGSALLGAGRVREAIAMYRSATDVFPDFVPAQIGLAMALLRSERMEGALLAAKRAVELAPGHAEAHFIQGVALRGLGRLEEAFAALQQALQRDPHHAAAHLALANVLLDLDQLAEGEDFLRTAIALDPALAEGHASLGFLLAGTGRLEAAIAACDAAIALRPDFARAYWNKSVAQMLQGDFANGWENYEWRKQHDRFRKEFFRFPGTEWSGEDLDGRTIIVHAEQGLGDTIQFARYLPLLAARGARVVIACAASLIPLLTAMPGVAQAIRKTSAFPDHDFWVDQMSLPRLFGTRVDTIPSAEGYLHAEPGRVNLRQPVRHDTPRIGIVWSGNPRHSNDQRRSMPVESLAPILELGGIAWVNLQVGETADALEECFGIPGLSPELVDFADTAGLVQTLDLVIAVDTSTAHLAGAMGKPVWVMLPYAPDWRWMTEREDSPWYKSMRLFRQTQPGDWNSVVARITVELERERDTWTHRTA